MKKKTVRETARYTAAETVKIPDRDQLKNGIKEYWNTNPKIAFLLWGLMNTRNKSEYNIKIIVH